LSIYFEATTNTSIDYFITPVLFVLFIVLVHKYPVFSEIVTDITKVKRLTFIRIFTALMLFGVIGFALNYSKKLELRNLIESKGYSVVDGCIEEYKIDVPKQGSKVESFKVGNIYFEFSNYDSELYFNSNDHIDNFLINGNCVSISYIQIGVANRIVKISS
jgi:hypothetical protein